MLAIVICPTYLLDGVNKKYFAELRKEDLNRASK